MDKKYVMATTVDADIHLFEGEIELTRLKVERNKWLVTVDGRFVKADKIVAVWVPDEDELRGFLGSVNANEG